MRLGPGLARGRDQDQRQTRARKSAIERPAHVSVKRNELAFHWPAQFADLLDQGLHGSHAGISRQVG